MTYMTNIIYICQKVISYIIDMHSLKECLNFCLGNKKLMKCDKVWNNLLVHYGRQGCVADAEFVRSKRLKKKHKQREATQEEFYS